jgi:2',3'-cyclic-nucleotide 2'-phosphodiesterase (5'-nucleotidase family)
MAKTPFVLLIFLLLLTLSPIGAENNAQVLILHTNDFHGQLLPLEDKTLATPPETVGGAAYMATEIKKIREKYGVKVLLLDAGDIAQGTPISNLSHGKPVVMYMNYLGYDAMAPGNHEFDWGFPTMKEMLKDAKFPILCANIIDEKSGKIPAPFTPYAIFERDGVKIGIIGLLTPDTVNMSNPRNLAGLKFLKPDGPVRQYMEELKTRGVKVIGLLSHMGVYDDRKMAEAVPGISFIIGGHSHTTLQNTEKIGATYIVQTGVSGRNLGSLLLSINRDSGAIASCTIEHELIPILNRNIIPDKEVEKILAPYYEKVKPIMNTVVGNLSEDMLNKPPAGYGDTPLGNFITDVIRATYRADIVIFNTEGIRAPLYKGDITSGDVFTTLPFDNEIVTIDLTGGQLRETLEFFIQNPKYIQVSGATLTYHPKREKGSRLEDITIGGKPLEPEKNYKLATVDFLYYTTGDFDVLRKGKNLAYGKVVRYVLEDYIKQHRNVGPLSAGEKRVTVIKD